MVLPEVRFRGFCKVFQIVDALITKVRGILDGTERPQRAKKAVSDSPGLVDFADWASEFCY